MIQRAMVASLAGLVLGIPLCGVDMLSVSGYQWTVEAASDWKTDGGVLQLVVPRQPPAGVPRRPQKFALADTAPFRKVIIEAEVKRDARSLILVYAYQDEGHFNYAHISSDAALKENMHNGMFHIFKGERVRMSPLDGPPSLPTQDWIPVKLVFDGATGRCYVEVNGKRNPSLEGVDLSLRWGRVGFGSFDETGSFRKIRISGVAKNSPGIGQQ